MILCDYVVEIKIMIIMINNDNNNIINISLLFAVNNYLH